MTVHLRQYQGADVDTVIDVFRTAVRIVAAPDYNPAQIAAWARVDRESWQKRLLDSHCWVASIEDKIVGFGNVEFDGHLDLMFTHPEYLRTGVASALLEKLEHAVITMALPEIFTEASVTAKPFFSRRGYQLLAAQQVQVRGQNFINYRMSKSLL
ncbi:GNAT family N-acetyltransferase [Erwinia aphidicola]|uniref:GNAT family N-acetyltransferase n=1 Tax=Erwinia aphidicola TaxID=68334 RepID=UPI0030199988